MVSLDGGDSYWVPRSDSDDPQRMLTEELPVWLAERGLGSVFGVFGISMGAYGALNYARAVPGLTVAAVSPALFLTWSEAEARDDRPAAAPAAGHGSGCVVRDGGPVQRSHPAVRGGGRPRGDGSGARRPRLGLLDA